MLIATMAPIRRELSRGQKKAIANAHAFIKRERKVGNFAGRTTRALVAECIGVGTATVGRVISAILRDPLEDFEVRMEMGSISVITANLCDLILRA